MLSNRLDPQAANLVEIRTGWVPRCFAVVFGAFGAIAIALMAESVESANTIVAGLCGATLGASLGGLSALWINYELIRHWSWLFGLALGWYVMLGCWLAGLTLWSALAIGMAQGLSLGFWVDRSICWFCRPFEMARRTALAIRSVDDGQRLIGILHKDGNQILLLHLSFHNKLVNSLPSAHYLWIDPSVPEARLRQVAAQLPSDLAGKQSVVPFAFSQLNDCFDQQTGQFLLGPSRLGLTCTHLFSQFSILSVWNLRISQPGHFALMTSNGKSMF